MPICQVLPPTTPPFSNQGEGDYNQMEQQEQLLELGGRESAGKMEVRGVKGSVWSWQGSDMWEVLSHLSCELSL